MKHPKLSRIFIERLANRVSPTDLGGDDKMYESSSEKLIMYHGSPYGGIVNFMQVKPPIFFTEDRETAKQYATTPMLAAQKSPDQVLKKVPTIYKVEISGMDILDFRDKNVLEQYSELRREYHSKNKNDPDAWMDYPPLYKEGFISSTTKLPMFEHAKPLMRLFSPIKHYDAIWVDEGTQGISLAVFDQRSGIKLLDHEEL